MANKMNNLASSKEYAWQKELILATFTHPNISGSNAAFSN
jgi:hypothetical protein